MTSRFTDKIGFLKYSGGPVRVPRPPRHFESGEGTGNEVVYSGVGSTCQTSIYWCVNISIRKY